MVDMVNAIDYRLGHCNGEFYALRSKNEKSNMWAFHVGFILAHMEWKPFNFSGFQEHVHGKLQEKSPDRYKIIIFVTFSGFSQKPETSKAHRNNSIVTREKRCEFASK